MKFTLPPNEYEENQRFSHNNYERPLLSEINSIQNRLLADQRAKLKKIPNASFSYGTYFKSMIKFIGVLAVLAIFVAFILSIVEERTRREDLETIIIAVLFAGPIIVATAYFVCGYVYGAIIGFLGTPIAYPLFLLKQSIVKAFVKSKIERIENHTRSAIETQTAPLKSRIELHRRETEQRIKDYKNAFEAEASKLSGTFLESPLSDEIVTWLTTKFVENVRNTDNAPHLKKINAILSFDVRKTAVVCDRETYDFEKHRCENLPDVLTQTALAMALATRIGDQTIALCDTHGSESKSLSASSSDTTVTPCYTYFREGEGVSQKHELCVIVTLTYTAPNGNYKPRQKW